MKAAFEVTKGVRKVMTLSEAFSLHPSMWHGAEY
jgi:hypothetical protein